MVYAPTAGDRDMFYRYRDIKFQSSNLIGLGWSDHLYNQGRKCLNRNSSRLVPKKYEGSSFNFIRHLIHSSKNVPHAETHQYYLTNSKNQHKIELIKRYTKISYNHITPEIGLHLITKDCAAWSWKQFEIKLKDPFWAFYWPGGQALTRYILDNSQEFKNETILDVGCGSGATAIAAARAQASEVVANDCDIDSCIATALNAELNNVNLKISQENFIGNADIPWNCIFIGDMFYNDEISSVIFKWIEDLHSRNKKIFIGDPGRLQGKNFKLKDRLKRLKTYRLKENTILECDNFSSVDVLSFCYG